MDEDIPLPLDLPAVAGRAPPLTADGSRNRHATRLKQTELCRTMRSRSKRAPLTMAGATTPASNEEADRLICKRVEGSSRNTRARRVDPTEDGRPERARDDLTAP